MTLRTLIVCKSVHHHNTLAIAEAMGRVLNADLCDPDETPASIAAQYDLIGFGSGVYFGRLHSALRLWIDAIPNEICSHRQVFLFSTSGLPWLWRWWHRPVRTRLRNKGFDVVGEFHCGGFDTFGPLCLFGGINRRHPNHRDLAAAAEFAQRLDSNISQATESLPGAGPSAQSANPEGG